MFAWMEPVATKEDSDRISILSHWRSMIVYDWDGADWLDIEEGR